jgi:hypothetical protein
MVHHPHARWLAGGLAALLAGCGGGATFDVQPVDDGAVADASDARPDVPRDAMDGASGSCDMALCNDVCAATGCAAGTCAGSRCSCRACAHSDAGPDAVEVLRNCLTNDDCLSPDQYCSGTGCNTLGLCSPRTPPAVCDGPPQCACDGRRYANACERVAAGVRRSLAESICPPLVDGGADAATDAPRDD